MKFLKLLIDAGANPNAYVLKLRQYREESTGLSQLSQISQSVMQQRRPPEKDQYLSEALGLCNVLHLLLE